MLTREQYIEKYGVDPAAPADVQEPRGTVANHLTSAVTGVATIPTDFINLIPTVASAGAAGIRAYRDDTPFLEEFQKSVMTEDAQKNVQAHIDTIAQAWQQSNPALTPDEINTGLAEYQKSKQFEDFMLEQKSGTHYLAAKAKDTVRKLLGDKRTEHERGWTESAAEVLPGAFIGGPAGIVVKGASKIPGVAAVASTKLGGGALRVAEAVTPLTIPYSGSNVAINAAAGLAIDQGLRYAQGQSTAFTPTKEDPNSVGTLSAIGGAALAGAAVVSAVKGRSQRLLQATQANPSHIEATLGNNPVIDMQVRQGDTQGQTLISAGDPSQHGPPSAMDEMGRLQYARTQARNQYIDQGAAITSEIRREHGVEFADQLEKNRTSNTGAVLADAIPARVAKSQQAVLDVEANMSPEQLRAVKSGHWMNSYSSDISTTHDALLEKIQGLKESLERGKRTPQAHTQERADLAKAENDLQRFINDDPSARPRLPTIRMARVHEMGNAFMADTHPLTVAYRQAVKNFNKEMLDLDVQSGKISQEVADKMHARNPYYVQAKDDPLKGAVGGDRMWKSITQSIRNKIARQSAGTGAGALNESPLRHLSLDIQPIRQAGDPETRITNALDTTSTMKMYAQRTHVDHAHTVTRNEHLRALYTGKDGGDSDLVKQGHMRAIRNGHGDTWWEGRQLQEPTLAQALNKENVVVEWQLGRARLWEFGDVEYARALRMEPILLSGVMKGWAVTSNTAKMLLTGRGAPWFAPVGAMYNMWMSVWTRHQSRGFGPMSTAALKYTPKWFAEGVVGRLPDVTALARWPYDVVASLVELQAYHLTRPIARELANIAPFEGLRKAVGERTYNAMVNKMLKVAQWADNTISAKLYKAGGTFGQQSIDNVPGVKNAFNTLSGKVPAPLRAIWQFYTDGIDSIWLAEKRQYYSQNHALLSSQHKGKIPPKELDRIVNEARTLAGDMSLVPASEAMRNLETIFPYLTQAKLSTYHLLRHMGSRDTASFVIPRMMNTMMLMGSSVYMMTYWDDAARKAYWNQSEQERYKHIWVPSPTLLLAWANGESPAYSRDLVYRLRVPPDFAGIIAGTTAMMQMMGMLPADATPKPLDAGHVGRVFFENLMPAMPPLLQAAAAQSGMKIEPQSSDTRGGAWIRNYQSVFKTGPEAESMTNLGQVSNTAALTMNALFGTLGGYVAQGTDVMLHAAKYHPQIGPNNQVIPRTTSDFAEGLKRATGVVTGKVAEKLPDIPLIWQNKDRYAVATPAWQYVAETNSHIRNIKDMHTSAMKKAANARRERVVGAGGIPTQGISDVVLAQIAEDVVAWDAPTGAFGKLKKQYSELVDKSRGVSIQYNMPTDERQKQINQYIMQQQDVKKQQQLAIQYAEQVIAAKYGMALKPLLKGRFVNLKTINELLRENIGEPAAAHADRQQVQ